MASQELRRHAQADAAREEPIIVASREAKNAFNTPTIHWVIIGICLLFSFIDMLLLSTAIERLLDSDQVTASTLAFFVAIVGNSTALLWGRSIALHKNRRVMQHHEAWTWLSICLLFIIIRGVVMMMDIQEFPDDAFSIIGSESLMAALLTILYVGTGLVIRFEASKIFDPTLFIEWRNIQVAKRIQNGMARKYTEAERLVIELEQFHKYNISLNKQYVIRKNALRDAERTTLSTVVRRALEDNPHLDPQVVEDILQSILEEHREDIPNKEISKPASLSTPARSSKPIKRRI